MKGERSWTTFGKWILAGEHAVLRGCPALVFPAQFSSLRLSHFPDGGELQVSFSGAYGGEVKLLFWNLMDAALRSVGRDRQQLGGHLEICNDLRLGAGLGASAALCVAIGRWWEALGWISGSDLYEFSRRLEDLFHGESSGVDIAAAIAGEGIRFSRGGSWDPITVRWQPFWYLSYSGQRGVTAECVRKVRSLHASDPATGRSLDRLMAEAVELAELALASDAITGLRPLAEAIEKASDCFAAWGLMNPELVGHVRGLREAGAIAAKPTGSGDGGYVLSLWRERPPPEILARLHSLTLSCGNAT